MSVRICLPSFRLKFTDISEVRSPIARGFFPLKEFKSMYIHQFNTLYMMIISRLKVMARWQLFKQRSVCLGFKCSVCLVSELRIFKWCNTQLQLPSCLNIISLPLHPIGMSSSNCHFTYPTTSINYPNSIPRPQWHPCQASIVCTYNSEGTGIIITVWHSVILLLYMVCSCHFAEVLQGDDLPGAL
jgi:hypothetical protein